MEALLHGISHGIAIVLQAVAVALVAIGSACALVNAGRLLASSAGDRAGRFQHVWVNHARWLVAALTFLLAADIVETAFSPTWDELGWLAAVAAMRTFLSYFLDREMENAARAISDAGRAASA
jgi:uncharacterized membrane protein